MSGCSSYTSVNLRRTLWDSAAQRSQQMGYDRQNLGRVQDNYHENYKCNFMASPDSQDISQAPRNYYFNTTVDPSQKAVIGFTGMNPNLYNDNLLPGLNTVMQNRYKSWEPFSTTANPIVSGGRVQFIPHEPVEVAPRQREQYWGADLNARLYERNVQNAAIESGYNNFHARTSLINLVAANMRTGGDRYTKVINGPQDTFAAQVKKCGPPATTNF
jgi:hypothetical protein